MTKGGRVNPRHKSNIVLLKQVKYYNTSIVPRCSWLYCFQWIILSISCTFRGHSVMQFGYTIAKAAPNAATAWTVSLIAMVGLRHMRKYEQIHVRFGNRNKPRFQIVLEKGNALVIWREKFDLSTKVRKAGAHEQRTRPPPGVWMRRIFWV